MNESQHQRMLIKWTQQAHIRRKYPVLKLLYHIPNERQLKDSALRYKADFLSFWALNADG